MHELEPLIVRHGHDVADFVILYRPSLSFAALKVDENGRQYWDEFFDQRKLSVPLPQQQVWPGDLPSGDVLLFDAAGRTPVVDGWGRLMVAATVTQRLQRSSQRAGAAQSAMDHVA
jgi:hypothetical protein